MEHAAEVFVSGLKCDKLGCDYRDDTVTLENYPDYVNAECPECGSNLLTQEDYDMVLAMLGLVDILNVEFGGHILSESDEEITLEITLEVKMKGDGSVEIVEEDDCL